MAEQIAPEVHGVAVGDLDRVGNLADLDELVLSDPNHFGIDVHVYIGEPGATGSDSFDMVVCSPSWFAEHAAMDKDWPWLVDRQPWTKSDRVLLGQGLWFMHRWSAQEFMAVLTAICADASGGPDWDTVANRIGRSIPWEFDYLSDADVNEGHIKRRPGNA